MRWLLIGLGTVLGVFVLLAGIGYAMPNAHVAQARADYAAPPLQVYDILSDVENWPTWHPSVESLTRLEIDGQPDEPAWRITGRDGTMDVVVTSRQPPLRFATRVDGGLFIGRWTYQIEQRASGSRVTITEEARIDNIVVRGLTILWNQTSTIERTLAGLGEALGERVEPVRVT